MSANVIALLYLVAGALFILALLFRGQAQRREVLLQEGRPAPWAGRPCANIAPRIIA